MSDLVPDEAWRAVGEQTFQGHGATVHEMIVASVEAAAPHIRAAENDVEAVRQESIAKEFGEKAAGFEGPKDFIAGYLAAVEDFAVGLRVRAAELRGERDA